MDEYEISDPPPSAIKGKTYWSRDFEKFVKHHPNQWVKAPRNFKTYPGVLKQKLESDGLMVAVRKIDDKHYVWAKYVMPRDEELERLIADQIEIAKLKKEAENGQRDVRSSEGML